MIANKNGPVRAIRSYIEANSGVYAQRASLLSAPPRRDDLPARARDPRRDGLLRLRAPARSGLTYRSSADGRGVTIDGVQDAPTPGTLSWESVDGPQNSLGIVHTFDTDIAPSPAPLTTWTSRARAAAPRRVTGDASSYGASSQWVTSALPNTDPTIGAAMPAGQPQPLLRLTRQGRRPAPPGSGAQPAPDDDRQLAVRVAGGSVKADSPWARPRRASARKRPPAPTAPSRARARPGARDGTASTAMRAAHRGVPRGARTPWRSRPGTLTR